MLSRRPIHSNLNRRKLLILTRGMVAAIESYRYGEKASFVLFCFGARCYTFFPLHLSLCVSLSFSLFHLSLSLSLSLSVCSLFLSFISLSLRVN